MTGQNLPTSTESPNPQTTDREPQFVGRNLAQRIVTTLVLLPVIVGCLVLGGRVFAVMVIFFAAVGVLEALYMTSGRQMRGVFFVYLLAGILVIVAFVSGLTVIWVGTLLVAVVLTALIERLQTQSGISLRLTALRWLLVLYVVFAAAFGIILRNAEGGLFWWMLIIGVTWGMDTLSFVGGRLYGKRPLAPQISPGKTVEGAVSGVVGAFVIGLVTLLWVDALLPGLIIMLLGAPVAALFGDLIESGIKRYFAVKDSYIPWLNVMPGHGGLLDRIDALLLVVIYFYIMLQLFIL